MKSKINFTVSFFMRKIFRPKSIPPLHLRRKIELPMVIRPVRIQCEHCGAFFPSQSKKPEAVAHACEKLATD